MGNPKQYLLRYPGDWKRVEDAAELAGVSVNQFVVNCIDAAVSTSSPQGYTPDAAMWAVRSSYAGSVLKAAGPPPSGATWSSAGLPDEVQSLINQIGGKNTSGEPDA